MYLLIICFLLGYCYRDASPCLLRDDRNGAIPCAHARQSDLPGRVVHAEQRGSLVRTGDQGRREGVPAWRRSYAGGVRGAGSGGVKMGTDNEGSFPDGGARGMGAWRGGGVGRFRSGRFGVAVDASFDGSSAQACAVGAVTAGGGQGASCSGRAGRAAGQGVFEEFVPGNERGVHYKRNKARREREKRARVKVIEHDRAALFKLRDERESYRLRREIQMERATLASGANVARVVEWCERGVSPAGKCKTVSSRDRSLASISDADESVMSAAELIMKREAERLANRVTEVERALDEERQSKEAAIASAVMEANAISSRAERDVVRLERELRSKQMLLDSALMDGYEPGAIAYAYDDEVSEYGGGMVPSD